MFFNEDTLLAEDITVEATETGLTGDESGAYRIIAESTEDWYNLREKMMRLEHTAIIREDAELLSEGVKEFFTKIIAYFKKLWAKVQEMWNKFVASVMQLASSDKAFLKKYESQILTADLTGFKFSGYDWNLDAKLDVMSAFHQVEGDFSISKLGSVGAETVKSLGEKWSEDHFNKLRGSIAGSGDVNSSEFGKAVISKFRKNSEKAEFAVGSGDVRGLISVVRDSNATIKALTTTKKSTDGVYKSIISWFTSAEKAIGKGEKKDKSEVEVKSFTTKEKNGQSKEGTTKLSTGGASTAYANLAATNFRKVSSIVNEALGLQIKATREARQEARAILARIATFKPGKAKDDTKSENYDFSVEGSVLDRFAQ